MATSTAQSALTTLRAPRPADSDARSLLDRALGIVSDVHVGEGLTALLLAVDVFLLLSSYYVIKPVREALIGGVPNGPEYKSYMGAAVAVTISVAVPVYSSIADRLPRNKLILGVGAFLHRRTSWGSTSWGVRRSVVEGTGKLLFALGFLLWVGVFNMMIVAQFWAFAADVYTEDEGKRLFPVVALLGASLGSLVGSALVERIVKAVGVEGMMLISAGLLGASTFLTQIVHRREAQRRRTKALSGESADAARKDEKKSADTNARLDAGAKKESAYALVFKNKYLLLVAIFTLVFSLVNTSGEYMLSSLTAKAATAATHTSEEKREWIAASFGSFFFYVNLAGVVIQTFLVSRIVKYGGLKVGFMIFPVVALLSAGVIVALPLLAVVKVGKTAENSLDYSLNNTMRNMLWLPTTRRMKYLAKQVVDSFFARLGDVGSALGVFLLVDKADLGVRGIAGMNMVLIGVWIFVAWRIVRENARLVRDDDEHPRESAEKAHSA